MSRHGYSEDNDDDLAHGRWRAQVASATRGKRGQQFFRDLVVALDALPEKALVKGELESPTGSVCALGALAKLNGISAAGLDTEDWDQLGGVFNIASQLAQETMYVNDGASQWPRLGVLEHADKARWRQVRAWAVRQIKATEKGPER